MNAESAIDPRAFRDAMGCYATAVTVVTTVTEDGRAVGVTVNSFNSVSLDPPLVLFSLSRDATHLKAFRTSGRFAVNVLHETQQAHSQGCATNGEAYLQDVVHRTAASGCAVLDDAVAVFDCRTHAIHDGGDHIIMIGQVTDLCHRNDGDPLLYYRGRYAAVRSTEDT